MVGALGGIDERQSSGASVDALRAWMWTGAPVVRLLIDGRAGTGKTTLAAALKDPGTAVVHMDDIYPGWDGLEVAAEAVFRTLIAPHAAGQVGRWQRWDWQAEAPAEWHEIDPETSVIVEGCGALSRSAAPLATHRIWMEAPSAERHRRAIGRDGELFAAHWDRWAAQEATFIAANGPTELADLVLRSL